MVVLYDFCLTLSIVFPVFLSFSGYRSSRHALFFPPIGHPSSHLVSDQGLSACILEFENIYIINMIQHQINSSSTDHHEHPWAKLVSTSLLEPNETFVLFHHPNNPCDFPVFIATSHDDIASGKERGFVFLDVWASIADVPNPWQFETWFQWLSCFFHMVAMTGTGISF